MRDVMRMLVNKVMQQNDLDVLVNPTTTIPPVKIGYASQTSRQALLFNLALFHLNKGK